MAKADRAAFLIDAKRYFEVLDRALPQARRRVVVVGWDFDSDMRLVPKGPTISERLLQLVEANRQLEFHILIWRSSLVYANNHDIPHKLGSNWWDHPRIHYRLDAQHPIGGSHHQKIVVLDDRLAFVGGIDLTDGRWDDCGHDPDCADRLTPKGQQYDPVHDVQMMVEGEAALAIGDVARAQTMTQATKHTPTPWKVMRRDSGWDIKAGSREVAIVFSRGDDVQQANAAHIVRCVNERAGLIEALEAIVDIARKESAKPESNEASGFFQIVSIARAALAKVQA